MTKIYKNAVVGQSGGPTSAINATLAGVISGALSADIPKIYGMRNGVEGLLEEDIFDLRGYFSSPDCENLELLSLTPAAALGSCRKKITGDDMIERLYEVFEKYEIGYFFYIGGNDSMDAVSKLSKYAAAHPEKPRVHFIGVPKTIDNDLVRTDHTPGFGSAAKYIANTVQEAVRDCAVYKTRAVTILEIMGRDAGWLTASAALSKALTGIGVSLIYLPEVAFSDEKFLSDLQYQFDHGETPYVVVAVSEGIRGADGRYVGEAAMSGAVDSFGHKYLAGTGKYLENLVRERLGCKVRSVEINILQRCAVHLASATDISESLYIGKASVDIALSGQSGVMAAFVRSDDDEYSVCVTPVDVTLVANEIKKVPAGYINSDGNGVTQECISYLRPLIAGECDAKYENGIQKHFSFL